jgi:Acyl-CoA carboxylase epsilon subunit
VSGEEPTPQERRALLRVVRGEPSDAEVAALTVVLAAAAAGTAASPRPRVVDRWSDPAARLRVPLHPGPGAWRAGGWPR